MFARPRDYFSDAMENGYALGAFNASNLELAQAIIWAAEAQKSPAIIQTSQGAIEYAGLAPLVAIVQSLASEVSMPIILHLDHGKSFEIVQRCIEAGYTSVMIDAAHLPYEENVALTSHVVEYAHDRDVWVEGELGAILGAEGMLELAGGGTPEHLLTDPDQVVDFTARTQVDALAVSVGTIHGAFSGQEYIRFELLEKIEKQVPDRPLVVHGASGIANEHLARVAQSHVCKINVDTEMRIAFEAAVKAYFDESHDKVDPRKILEPARSAMQQVVEGKLALFGSAGKFQV